MNEAIFPAVIDNSMRKELVKCEMAAHYRYEMGLESTDSQRVDLHAGKAFAAGVETFRKGFYKHGLTPEAALDAGVAAIYLKYGNFVPPAKSNKTASRMAGALAFMQQESPIQEDSLKPVQFPNGEFAIEVQFDEPIGIMHPTTGKVLRYVGRFDVLALDLHKQAWVVDEKTTSQMGEKWANQFFLDSQVTGYCWGARKLLDKHGLGHIPVAGAVINGIAIRLRDYEYQRLPVFREPWEVERWYHQMVADVIRWKNAFINQRHNQALDHACAFYNNPCQFAPLCKSRNPERLIEGSFVVRRWNPVTRED